MISNQQVFINKRQIRVFKYILLSPLLEKLALFSYLLLFSLILFFFATQNLTYNSLSSHISRSLIQNTQDSYANKKITIDLFLKWFENGFISSHLSMNQTFFRPLGAMRIIQYRLMRDESCYSLKSNFRYSKSCNPFFQTDWSPYLRTGVLKLPSNRSLCIEANCNEFSSRYIDFAKRTTKWKDYPNNGYYVTIPAFEITANIKKLKTNGFFSNNETMAIICEWNHVDLRYYNIFSIQLFIEMPSTQEGKIGLAWHNISYKEEEDFFVVALIPLYLFIMVLLTLKGIFEMSYFDNKITCIFNLSTYIINLIFAIGLILENAQYRLTFPRNLSENTSSFIESKEFISVNKINFYADINEFLLFFAVIPFPFKFFEFMTWNKSFHFLRVFINTIYRTFIPLRLYGFSFVVLSLGWTLGYFLYFAAYEKNFESLWKSFLSIFFGNNFEFVSTGKFNGLFILVEIFSNFTQIIKILYFGFLVSAIIFSYYKASSLEYKQFYLNSDKELNENFVKISNKIDKFVKKYLPNLQQDTGRKSVQMVIWLSSGLLPFSFENEVIEQCNQKEIRVLIFNEPREIIQFLSYLFKLKPNLVFSSDNYFRILLEFSKETSLSTRATLLWLQDYGCRVPVFLFLKENISEKKKGILKRVYKYLNFTTNIEDVKEFVTFKLLFEIKWKPQLINTISEIDSSNFSHSFELDNLI